MQYVAVEIYVEDNELYFETCLVFLPIAVCEIFKVEIGVFRKLSKFTLFELSLTLNILRLSEYSKWEIHSRDIKLQNKANQSFLYLFLSQIWKNASSTHKGPPPHVLEADF